MFAPGVLPLSGEFSGWGVGKIGYTFGLGFTLAGPFVLAAVVYNLGLGVINKAMPQLMVAFVGAPAISFGGIALLLIASPFLLSIWLDAFLNGTDLQGGALR